MSADEIWVAAVLCPSWNFVVDVDVNHPSATFLCQHRRVSECTLLTRQAHAGNSHTDDVVIQTITTSLCRAVLRLMLAK